MKSFREYLLEMKLTKDLAAQILSLSINDINDKSKIKKAYLKRAKETHPDTGGTAKDFRDVKDAYDYLTSTSFKKNDIESKEKQNMKNMQYAYDTFKNEINPKGFFRYLNIMMKNATFKDQDWEFIINPKNKRDIDEFTFRINAKLTLISDNQNVIFTIYYNAELNNMNKGGSLGDGNTLSFDVNIHTSVLVNNRKIDLKSHSYKHTNKNSDLNSITELIPKNELEKIDKKLKSKSKRKVSRRDILTFITSNLNVKGTSDKDSFMAIPKDETFELNTNYTNTDNIVFIKRDKTFKGEDATWSIGISKINGERFDSVYGIPESDEMIEHIKELKIILNSRNKSKMNIFVKKLKSKYSYIGKR